MVDNAKVTATDIDSANGLIHIINTVFLPKWACGAGPRTVKFAR